MFYTVDHPRVALILPPVDMQERTRWDSYKSKVLGIWPGEESGGQNEPHCDDERTWDSEIRDDWQAA